MSDNNTQMPTIRPMTPRTAQAFSTLPSETKAVFERMWTVTPEAGLQVQSDLIKQTAEMLADNARLHATVLQQQAQDERIRLLEESLLRQQAGVTDSTPATTETGHTDPSASAQTAARKAILKSIRPIDNYSGAVKFDAARKYLRDCERYFKEVTLYAQAEPDDKTKIAHASGRLLNRAYDTWRAYEDQVAGFYGDEITTWQAYKDWISREFSEHLGPEKRWDRFEKMTQGKLSFHEYASNLQQAARDCEITIPEPILIQHLRKGANVNLQKRWAEDRDRPTALQDVIQRFIEFERGAMVAGYLGRTNGDPMDLSAMNGRGKNMSQTTCYNCQKKGHFARNCKAPKKKKSDETGKEQGSKN
jgi:hypothetical protein